MNKPFPVADNEVCILITGGTGSFGQAFVRTLLTATLNVTLRVLSRNEHRQVQMAEALQDIPGHAERVRYLLGDVRDSERLVLAMRDVHVVVHAAALKHVPSGEYNPAEVIKTNIDGTWNVAMAAMQSGVRRAVLLSSDKAVAPANLYGATKFTAERLWVHANSYSPLSTNFCAVRYGNVAQSNGSVLQVFRRCLSQQRPLPVTSLDMTRFWLTLADAVALVRYTLQFALRGTIIVPELSAFTLKDLCCALLDIDNDYDLQTAVKIIGARPGEKQHETLLDSHETSCTSEAYWPVVTRAMPSPPCRLFTIYPSLLKDLPAHHGHQFSLPSDFSYQSNTWPLRLTVPQLRDALKRLAA